LLADEGARVVIADTEIEDAERLHDELAAEGSASTVAVRVDVGVEQDVIDLAAAVDVQFGKVDILVNNAAARVWGPVTDVTRDSWLHITNINVISIGLVSKYIIPLIDKAGGGSIVNVSSVNAIVGRRAMAQ